MKRLRPRTTILGGAAIGLVAGVAAFGATSSTTATTPVTKPASFTKLAPVSVAKPPPPVRPKMAPCAKNQELKRGVCIVHVERVVVHYKPAAPVQAMPQSSSQSQSGGNSGNQPQAAANASHSPEPQERSRSAAPRSHESESGDREDSNDNSEHAAEQETEGDH